MTKTQPLHCFRDACNSLTRRYVRPVHHNDRYPKCSSRIKLGTCRLPTGILGDQPFNAMVPQESEFGVKLKGSAACDDRRLWDGQWSCGFINKAQQVVVLWRGSKVVNLAPSNRQEDFFGVLGQGADRGWHVVHLEPVISGDRLPGRALYREQPDTNLVAGCDGITAHPGGEGMGCINDVRDVFGAQVIGQTGNVTKTANAYRQGLWQRVPGAACIREYSVRTGVRQGASQLARFGCAAEKQDVRHV